MVKEKKPNHFFKDSEFPKMAKVRDMIQDTLASIRGVKGSKQKETRSFLPQGA